MHKTDLTQFDIKPEAMVNYLRYNGPHFNKKLLQFATSKMTKKGINGKETAIVPYTIEQVDNIIRINNINLEYNQLYDYVFVANMCKADYLGSSITDEMHLAKYIKDVIDDVDGYDGIVFNRWYADMCRKGIVINWEEMI
jgi:hypothetical protein